MDGIDGAWCFRKLTTATLPDVEAAPTARLDCRNVFLNIFVELQRKSELETEQRLGAIGAVKRGMVPIRALL